MRIINPSGGIDRKGDHRWTFLFDATAPAGSAMKARFSGDRPSVIFFFLSSLLMQKHTAKQVNAMNWFMFFFSEAKSGAWTLHVTGYCRR